MYLLAAFAFTALAAEPNLSAIRLQIDDDLQLRGRYGAALHSGFETDLGPGLSYGGLTPNDVALAGWWWPLLDGHLGLTAAGAREGFALFEGTTRLTSGGVWRAHVGPTGRYRLGPFRAEVTAAYGFQQLPIFGTAGVPTLLSASRHSLQTSARAILNFGPICVEGRVDVPIGIVHSGPLRKSSGLSAGGGIFNGSSGTLHVTDSTFSTNSSITGSSSIWHIIPCM